MIDANSGSSLLRMIGLMAICVGLAWAVQVLAYPGAGAVLTRMAWIVGAASIAGAGSGAVFAAASLQGALGSRA